MSSLNHRNTTYLIVFPAHNRFWRLLLHLCPVLKLEGLFSDGFYTTLPQKGINETLSGDRNVAKGFKLILETRDDTRVDKNPTIIIFESLWVRTKHAHSDWTHAAVWYHYLGVSLHRSIQTESHSFIRLNDSEGLKTVTVKWLATSWGQRKTGGHFKCSFIFCSTWEGI